jgi:hypothetical protein
MLNKSVITGKPITVLGDFWQPILERVREVEQAPQASSGSRVWAEANGSLVHTAATPDEAARYLAAEMKKGN